MVAVDDGDRRSLPARAISSAIARPIPCPAPVTSATLPSSIRSPSRSRPPAARARARSSPAVGLGLAGAPLALVDRAPAAPRDGARHALGDPVRLVASRARRARPRRHPRRSWRRCRPRPSCWCRSRRSGPRLIQPTTYSPRCERNSSSHTRPPTLRIRSAPLVERNVVDRRGPGTRSSAGRGRTRSPRSCPSATARRPPRPSGSILLRTTCSAATGPCSPSPSSATGERRKRRLMRWRACRPARAPRTRAASPTIAPCRGVRLLLEPARAVLVELELGGIDVNIRARQLAQLAQLGIGERRLRRSSAAEQHDLLDLGLARARRGRGRRYRSGQARTARARACARHRPRRCRCRSRRPFSRSDRTAPGQRRDGRCTRRRSAWPGTSPDDPRLGCRGGCRRRSRRRRRRRGSASSSSVRVMSEPSSTPPKNRKPGFAAVLS